jgi:hypothetical protein
MFSNRIKDGFYLGCHCFNTTSGIRPGDLDEQEAFLAYVSYTTACEAVPDARNTTLVTDAGDVVDKVKLIG